MKHYVPAEWARQKALWCGWPSDPDLWPDGLLEAARGEIAAMLRFMAEDVPVKVVASGDEAVASAKAMLGDCAEIVPAKLGDVWLRDTGPIWSGRGALRFKTNGWGGKYIYDGDDEVGDTMAGLSGASIIRNDFVLEGGAVDHNGAGFVLTTRQCLIRGNRNPPMSEAEIEAALIRAFDAERIFWLEDGLLNDHTDGHVDNLARFVDENTVVCPKISGKDDPNEALYAKTASDLRDFGFEVIEIPNPGLVLDRLSGEVAPASHMNFIIGNGRIAVPTYDADERNIVSHDAAIEAVRILQNLFPDHKVKGFPASSILTGGGSFHCITQQEPEFK